MSFHDRFGCDVTTKKQTAIDHWNNVITGFLSHSAATGNHLAKALELDPNFALAHACKGIFSLMLGRRELDETIISSYEQARQSTKICAVTPREELYIQALQEWIAGRPSLAVEHMETILKSYPHDPLAMKISHGIRFMLGDLPGMLGSLKNLESSYKGHQAEGYFKGCMAFSLEEAGEYNKAEQWGKQAIELCPDDAWGLHAVSHVFDMTGRAKEGLAWIEGKAGLF